MNAKKIMGAVLVALLAAALFVGAGAADDKGTYFVYQESTGLKALNGTWTNGAYSVVIEDAGATGVVMPVGDFVAGTYTKGKDTIYVTYPTASYKLTAEYNGVPYLVANGGTVYNNSNITLTILPLATGTWNDVKILQTKGSTSKNISNPWTDVDGTPITSTGTYKIQALFGTTGFVKGVPADVLLDANAFTFKVVGADEATISASVDTVYAGNKVTVTVVGTPGTGYAINATNVTVAENQLITVKKDQNNFTFTMPNTGKASFDVKIDESAEKEVLIKLIYDGKYVKGEEVKIKISAPVVTATLVKPSYFLGEAINVTGTATADQKFTFNISGTNIKEFQLKDDMKAAKNWKANLTLPDGKDLDVGTYTIKVMQGDNTVATLAVALKQPFISIAEAPEVIAQDEEATFLITAEAADSVMAYFFGTNYFKVLPSKDELDEDDKVIPNLFNVTLTEKMTNKSEMATGQYFAVFQHPMYDGDFNIGAYPEGSVMLNNNGKWNVGGKEIFNATSRQTANAAQALCDALDSQLIDDMYVKYSFFVVKDLKKDTFSMSEIPSEVVKGDKIVISGIDTASKEGTPVTVEMISTAFAAVPKETVGSAAFIVVTTEIGEDGKWEVTLDTSDLNVDEYSLSVAIDAVEKESVTVNVVAAADKPDTPDTPDVPDTPDTPDTPTEPETPGFGALAALAGLGAVAVLLLRRE